MLINKTGGIQILALFGALIFMPNQTASAVSKQEMLSVGILLDPQSSYYGKEVLVFGYLKLSGSEANIYYGRLCLDRESAIKNYRPNCLTLAFPDDQLRFAKTADGNFSFVQGTAAHEDVSTTYAGKLEAISRIEKYDAR